MREVRLTDTAALRAMAHPLRMRILGSLRIDGPATSALLARRLGTDSGQTSHHLRLLARHGFVAEAPELGRGVRGRERWWKAAHETTRFTDDLDGPGAAAFEDSARQVWDQLGRTYRAQAERGEWSREWRAAAGVGDTVVRLTPARLAELRAEIDALITSYDETSRADEGRVEEGRAEEGRVKKKEEGRAGRSREEGDEGAETVVIAIQAYPRRA